MKKEFGKWFLDLAKYILTAIILTAFFAGLEQTVVLWGALVFFLVSIIVGYILLVQADKEKLPPSVAPFTHQRIEPENSEPVVEQKVRDTKNNKRNSKKNKKR